MYTTPQCRICRRPLALVEVPAGVCRQVPCQHADYQRKAGLALRARDQAIETLYQLGVRRRMVEDPASYRLTHLPANPRRIARLSRERRLAFEAHLDRMIAESFAREPEPARPSPAAPHSSPARAAELDAVSGQACAGCRGHCCLTGSTHAWISASTIDRYRRAHPEATPAGIRADYLSQVTGRSYHQSCVYHGRFGCTLQQPLRADICNTHFCSPLRQLRASAPEGEPVKALMVWPRTEGQVSVAFVDAKQTREIRAPRSAPKSAPLP